MMIDIEPSIKKKKGADFFKLDSDLDENWVLQHQADLVAEQRQKIEKKFQKENEKLVAEGKKPMKEKELTERMEVASELEKMFKKENKTKKVEAEGRGPTVERMEANLEKLDARIRTMRLQAESKESNKEVALGTSKIVSSIRPRLLVLSSRIARTTLIPALRLSSPKNSTYRLSGSSPRPFARSLTGRSNLSTRTGSFRLGHLGHTPISLLLSNCAERWISRACWWCHSSVFLLFTLACVCSVPDLARWELCICISTFCIMA